MTAGDILRLIKSDSTRAVVSIGYKANRTTIDNTIPVHLQNISKHLPGFRHPKDAPAAKVENLILSQELWKIAEVALPILKGWFTHNKQLETKISGKLISCGYSIDKFDFEHDRVFPKKLRDEDIRKSEERWSYFYPAGQPVEGCEDIEATLMACCLGWSVIELDVDAPTSSSVDSNYNGNLKEVGNLNIKQTREELGHLSRRLSKIETKLETALADVRARGQFPARELGSEIVEIADSAKNFGSRIAVLLQGVAPGRQAGEQLSISAFSDAIELAEAAQSQQKEKKEKGATALQVLDDFDSLKGRSPEADVSLSKLKSESARLRKLIQSNADIELVNEILGGGHPISLVMDCLSGKKLSDEKYQQIMATFGLDFYNSMIRGEIGHFEAAAAPEPSEPPKAPVDASVTDESPQPNQNEETLPSAVSPEDQTSREIPASALADAILNGKADFDGKLTELQWSLIREDHLDVALYLCQDLGDHPESGDTTIPSWLLDALLLSGAVLFDLGGGGTIAERLRNDYEQFVAFLISSSSRLDANISYLLAQPV